MSSHDPCEDALQAMRSLHELSREASLELCVNALAFCVELQWNSALEALLRALSINICTDILAVARELGFVLECFVLFCAVSGKVEAPHTMSGYLVASIPCTKSWEQDSL